MFCGVAPLRKRQERGLSPEMGRAAGSMGCCNRFHCIAFRRPPGNGVDSHTTKQSHHTDEPLRPDRRRHHPTGQTLTIEAGVRVEMQAGDATAGGIKPGLTEVIVNGALVLTGTPARLSRSLRRHLEQRGPAFVVFTRNECDAHDDAVGRTAHPDARGDG